MGCCCMIHNFMYEAHKMKILAEHSSWRQTAARQHTSLRSVVMCRYGTTPLATMTSSLTVRLPPSTFLNLSGALNAAAEHLRPSEGTIKLTVHGHLCPPSYSQ